MTKTLLAWLGALLLLALVGTAVGGLMLVKDRVRVVIEDDATPDEGARQVAQLRDELGQVQRDVQALATALGEGLQRLAEDGANDLAARHADLTTKLQHAEALVASVRGDLQVAQTGQQALQATMAKLEAATRELAAARSVEAPAAESAGPTPNHATDPLVDQPQGATAAPAAEVAAKPAAPDPVPAEPAARPAIEPPPRRRSAFAFTLPSQSFTFDLQQEFELLPSLSRVGFDAKSTLHDFTGVTSKLRGKLELNLAQPGKCAGEIRVDAKSLDTGLAGRNDAMHEHLDTTHWPEIVFTLTGMTADEVDAQGLRVHGKVRGTLAISGKTRDVEMPVELSVDESKRVHAKGEMPLKLSDYEVPVPSQLGMIKMQDEVKVWIALQARALGKERQR